MNLSNQTLNALALILTGDNKISPYLSGPMLVDFFNNIGFAEIYYQGFPTRIVYAKDKLVEINNNPRIECAINEIVDKKRFANKSFNLEYVVNYLNDFLRIDGYEIVYKDTNYKIISSKNKNTNNLNIWKNSEIVQNTTKKSEDVNPVILKISFS